MDYSKRTVKVVGIKLAAWEMEGKKGVTSEIYREVALDDRRNNGTDRIIKGLCTAAIRVPEEVLRKVAHLPVPFTAELTEEEVSNGKTVQNVVVDLRPVDLVKPAQPAKAAP
ncbi:hypothetical protein QRD43_22340 [Pelomonas sp. APW6]|uniref:Uncharacterized protein n=1 Tax=Roseateles subflavus TaxID=3053353 RepID=A0ABT7LQE3_9BURK|nr:hypothetical protein [Pelomonas sp. APW6]MDL5034659.1 hypothetical protein [Pelomonas sp. APW6]